MTKMRMLLHQMLMSFLELGSSFFNAVQHASKRTRWRSVCPVLGKGISGFFLWWSLSLGRKQLNELWELGDTEKHGNNGFHRPHTHSRWYKTAEPSQLQLPVPTAGSPDPQSSQRSPSPGLPSLLEIWIESQDWKVSDPLKFTQSGRIRTRSSCVLSLNIKGPLSNVNLPFLFPTLLTQFWSSTSRLHFPDPSLPVNPLKGTTGRGSRSPDLVGEQVTHRLSGHWVAS